MARISEEELNIIKQSVSLVELMASKGYQLKAHGKDFAVCCPFHQDDTASLIVTPANNLWHCMGACQMGGSVIDWVMKTKGLSFRYAVELLKNNYPLLAAKRDDSAPKLIKYGTTQKLESPLSADADNQTALKQVLNYYHQVLKESPEALEYLALRGLNNAALIEHFRLGYLNRTLAYRLPNKNRAEGAALRNKLLDIGLLRATGHEHFNGSLVVPVFSLDGEVLEVYGRKVLGKRLRIGTAMHTYLPGPHLGVWNEAGLKTDKTLFCVNRSLMR